MNSPQALGKKVARTQDRLFSEAAAVEKAERGLFDAGEFVFKKNRRVLRPTHFAWAAGIAAMLLGLYAMHTRLTQSELTATINGKPVDLRERLWVAAEAEEETAIAFSDGSTVELTKQSRARFLEVSDTGAALLVDKGELRVDVKHTDQTDWRLYAGPFEVIVTGTRFSLTWDSSRAFFSVEMTEGRVEIEAPMLVEAQAVSAGERFTAWVNDGRLEIASIQRHDSTQASAVPTANPERGDGQPVAASSPSVSKGTEGDPERAAQTDETAERRESAESGCQAATAESALRRADRRQRDGDIADAKKRYLATRRCFPGTREAVLASFNLGKIEFDRQRDWAAAAQWFERYLAEQNGEGPVREAMGRLMEAYMKANNPTRARETAKRYLDRYPEGPHAGFATSLVD